MWVYYDMEGMDAQDMMVFETKEDLTKFIGEIVVMSKATDRYLNFEELAILEVKPLTVEEALQRYDDLI